MPEPTRSRIRCSTALALPQPVPSPRTTRICTQMSVDATGPALCITTDGREPPFRRTPVQVRCLSARRIGGAASRRGPPRNRQMSWGSAFSNLKRRNEDNPLLAARPDASLNLPRLADYSRSNSLASTVTGDVVITSPSVKASDDWSVSSSMERREMPKSVLPLSKMMMKAWVLADPGQLNLIDKALPAPGVAEVLVRVDAVAICATDLEVIAHGPPAVIGGEPPFNKNFTPGHEYMGTIV